MSSDRRRYRLRGADMIRGAMDDPRLRHADDKDAVHQPSVTGHEMVSLVRVGAPLATCADMLVRLLPTHYELEMGAIVAFLGVSVFIAHLLRERRTW